MMQSVDDIAVRVQGLHKAFGKHQILKGINLEIPRGKTTIIIGGSGSGKSVLIKHIIGLLRPDRGTVEVDGEDITRMSERALTAVRGKFGMLFQHAALFDSMTVADNVAFPLKEHTRLSRKQIRIKVSEQLEILGLPGSEDKWPAELSGGMRKRVGLARALMMDPQFLIYDEPTTGLDPILAHQVDQMILDTQERLGVTSIVISHDMASTFRLAHQIAMLYHGEIVVTGDPAALSVCEVPRVQEFIRVSGVQLDAIRGASRG
ncbi:MAG: phospholipid/cholesterol/gamma-HCH transport system ATP-binding protein [Myxococcota bacterium]|jgi:phospholipid/cholesterol/gamma-HCH transport system ATP-binding protein